MEHRLLSKMADWSELSKDVAIKIAANYLESYDDFMTFSGVCSQWRSAAKEAANIRPADDHQVPWLLLPPPQHNTTSPANHHPNQYRFYSLSKQMVRPLNYLPPPIISYNYQWFLSSHGWLLSRKDRLLSLLNPLSGDLIELPTLPPMDKEKSRFDYPSYSLIDKFVLSANPTTTSDYTVVVITDWGKTLLSWKNGDPYNWTNHGDPFNQSDDYVDATFSHGELYAVQACFGRVVTFPNVKNKNLCLPPRLVSMNKIDMTKSIVKCYFVELIVGQLVIVHREVSCMEDRGMTVKFQVFEVDVEKGEEHNEVKSLGNRAIFVGFNSSFSVEAYRFDRSCKPNRIYYTDYTVGCYMGVHHAKRVDMGVYNLGNGEFENGFYNGPSRFTPTRMPPVWVEPPSLRPKE